MKKAAIFVLVLALSLLTLAMPATPVIAIGPENAENNPNTDLLPYGVGLPAPSGMINEWVNHGPPVPKHFMWMDASEFKINHAYEVTSTSEVSGLENKWVFFSMAIFETWIVEHGIPAGIAHMIALRHPDGVYYREVWVGH
jgi:hypothetical protein